MNDRQFRNYIAHHHFTVELTDFLRNINNIILDRYRRHPNSLQNVIYTVEERSMVFYRNYVPEGDLPWIEDYFDIVRQLSIGREQNNEHKNYYDREFEF